MTTKTYKFPVETCARRGGSQTPLGCDLDNTFFKKECPGYPNLPTVLPEMERVIAIGDIHGDYNLAVRCLLLAKVIDDKLNWVAVPPTTVVVQVGDQIDSCRPYPEVYDCHNERKKGDTANDVKVIQFFDMIDKKARLVGGMVISLLGNHEIMNSQGIFSYVSYANYNEFKYKVKDINLEGREGRKQAFAPGGPLAKHLACSRLSAVIIGSNLFVHAGILPSLLNKIELSGKDERLKVAYINQVVSRWLLNKLDAADKDDLANLLNSKYNSPFWPRILGTIDPDIPMTDHRCHKNVGKVLNVLKIGNIIIGHTPQLYRQRINCYR